MLIVSLKENTWKTHIGQFCFQFMPYFHTNLKEKKLISLIFWLFLKKKKKITIIKLINLSLTKKQNCGKLQIKKKKKS